MRDSKRCLLLVLVCWFGCRPASNAARDPASETRPAAVAGQFYPAEPARLKLAVQKFLEDASPATVEQPVAIIVPHAGYIYSGQIAADAFRAVSRQNYDVILILGTNHTVPNFDKIAVYSSGAFETPLGKITVDNALANALMAEDKDCVDRKDVHEHEHSVEVQIPFIQVLFPQSRILPLVIGSTDEAKCTHLGLALAKIVKGRHALIVASSDLSHYPAYEDASVADSQFLESIASLDPKRILATGRSILSQRLPNLDTVACGEFPVLSAVTAAKSLGASRALAVSYANSGDISVGDRSRVVGYGAMVLDMGKGPSDVRALKQREALPKVTPLQSLEKASLLAFARQTLDRFFTTGTVPLARAFAARLQVPQGAFVTLKERGELRGCIGHMSEDTPLCQVVGSMAMQAAFNDRRFDQLRSSELRMVEIEISVLTPRKPVSKPEDIVIGKDGVVIIKQGRSAVFLPQVAPEQKWGRTELLENLCLKAGLPREAYKTGASLFVFQADVFRESSIPER